MILLFIFGYVFLEIYVFAQVWERFGFVNMVFALLMGLILGLGIVRNQGRYILFKMQEAMMRGQEPTDSALNGLMIFLGGILFIIPGFVSDALGLLLVLPGTRHILVAIFKRRIAQKLKSGQFRVFTSFGGMGGSAGFGVGMGGMRGPFGASTGKGADAGADADEDRSGSADEQWARDVSPKVIDVTPLSVESHERHPVEPTKTTKTNSANREDKDPDKQ